MPFLKQATAACLMMGPFVSEDDGYSACNDISIDASMVLLSKAGAAIAAMNSSTSPEHSGSGYFQVTLDTTDTGTLGTLKVAVSVSPTLPVWETYDVLSSCVWDAWFSDGAKMTVDVDGGVVSASDLVSASDITSAVIPASNIDAQMSTLATAAGVISASDVLAASDVQASACAALSAYKLDHLVFEADADDPADNSIIAKLAASGGDWSTFTASLNSLEAMTDNQSDIVTDTAEIGAAGAGLTAVPWNSDWDTEVESEVDDALGGGTGTALTAVPWNSDWDAEVQSEVNDALVALKLDHLIATSEADDPVNNSIIAKLAASGGDWSTFTASLNSLEAITDDVGDVNAATGISASDVLSSSDLDKALTDINLDHLLKTATAGSDMTTEVADNTVMARILANGDTSAFDQGTDGLQLIRDKLTDIETDTGEIGAAGAGLTQLGGMATSMMAEVQSEANDALVALKLDHLVAAAESDDPVDNSIIAKLAASGGDWSTFTASLNALEALADNQSDIVTDTAEIGAAGAGLTAVPWNSDWDTEVESEVDDALGGGTGTALTAIPWNSDWDTEVQSEVNDALVALKLDHLIATSEADDPADNSIIAKLAASGGDWSTFTASLNSLEAITDDVGDISAAQSIAASDVLSSSDLDKALTDINLDHLLKTATAGSDMTTEVADNTIMARILANGDTSAFDQGTDGLQLIRDKLTDIETDTGEIGAAGAGLTQLGGMATSMMAEVQKEVDDALVAQKLDHLVNVADSDDAADNSLIAKLAASTGDWSDFTGSLNSLVVITNNQANIETDTAEIGAAGAGLTQLGGLSTCMMAEVQSEVNDALVAVKLDHLVFAAETDDAADNSIIAKLAASTGDWSDYTASLNSMVIQTTNQANIEADTQDLQSQIGTAGAGLTQLGGMATSMMAEVQSEVNDALVALNLDHLLATATAGSDMTTEVVDNTILSRVLANGDTSAFDPTTDGLQLIRDKLSDIETDTGEIGTAGAGLTQLGGMSTSMMAEVQSEANDALVAQKLDHLVAVADGDDPVNDSIIAKITASTGDWSDFSASTQSLVVLATNQANIETDTAEIGTAGAGLTQLGGLSTCAMAEVQKEVDDGLVAQKLDHLVNVADSDDPADNSIMAKLAASGGDWSTFSPSSDALEALADNQSDIVTDTAEIGAAGAGLSAIPWNSDWDTEVESEVDDALGGGTGTSLTAVPWNSDWDTEVQSEVNDALVALKLDHLVAASESDDPVDNSILAKLAASGGDWSAFSPSSDALEAVTDNINQVSTATGLSASDVLSASDLIAASDIADAVWDETSAGHTDAGKAGLQMWTDVDAILSDTGTDGVVLSTATQQSIADETLKRDVSNVESSACDHSLTTIVLATLESSTAASVWTIKQTDGSTTYQTKTLTLDGSASAITGVS